MIWRIPLFMLSVSTVWVVLLLFASAQTFGATPQGEPEGLFEAIAQFGQQLSTGSGERSAGVHASGVHTPHASPVRSHVTAHPAIPTARPMRQSLLMRPMPQTSRFISAFFKPAPYQQVQQPYTGYGSPYEQGLPLGVYGPEVDPAIANPPGHNPQDTVPERIVYVPYASPPPIYVERLGKKLMKPLTRRGDMSLQEYPEMPLNLYTTRGPRDFLATDPPSIGY